jgi:hypothetical protein
LEPRRNSRIDRKQQNLARRKHKTHGPGKVDRSGTYRQQLRVHCRSILR